MQFDPAPTIDHKENLVLYAKAGCKPINGWSASRTGTNVYNVSYDFDNGGGGEQQAIWSVNIVTKQVKYLKQKQPAKVRRFFHEKHVTYAAA